MATSGWQVEKDLVQRSSAVKYIGSVRIDSIVRHSDNIVVSGKIRFGSRGSNTQIGTNYVNGVQAKPGNNSGWDVILGSNEFIYNSQNKDINFSTTIGVSSTATSASLVINYKACRNASCTDTYWTANPSWTLYFDPYGTKPSGITPTYNSSTWNSVNATVSVSDWGTGTPNRVEGIMVVGYDNNDFDTINASNWTSHGRIVWQKFTSSSSETINMSSSNIDLQIDGPLQVKGMRRYYLAGWAVNSVDGAGGIDMTVRYLPPAPPQFTYTDPGGVGAKTYPVTFTGDTSSNNSSIYFRAGLTRSVRYKIDNGNWVTIDSDTQAELDFVTSFNVTVPAGSVATVEGWMTYYGMQSEVVTVTISNTNTAVALYGSVSGQTKLLKPVYASVNGRTRKLVKIYASVGGVTKKVYEDV